MAMKPPGRRQERLCCDVPEGYGLLISFENSTCTMEFTKDEHFSSIHPNAYGPKSMTNLCRLGGGGSGVRVFAGEHPSLGPLVMKHGGHKDTKELFSLATIAQELKKRESPEANDLLSRTPEFKMVYISPRHLRQRPRGAWSQLTNAVIDYLHTHSNNVVGGVGGSIQYARRIQLFASLDKETRLSPAADTLDVILGPAKDIVDRRTASIQCGADGEGYATLEAFCGELAKEQEDYFWKFTLAQKTIGGSSPRTAASYLAKGDLHGDLLKTLVEEFVLILRNLQCITRPEEEDVIDQVRAELAGIQNDRVTRADGLSDVSDAFVGFAIKKNWCQDTGRFMTLRRMGRDFRAGGFHLEPEEHLPSLHLGNLLKPRSCLGESFRGNGPGSVNPQTPTELDSKACMDDAWVSLLEEATSLVSDCALKRVYNCGFSDAGIHNLFLSSDRVWLFDLGEPRLQSIPGLLTKFLFSFMHTLGMVDDKENGGWVNRFVVTGNDSPSASPGEKLDLTSETKVLLPKACDAFKFALDRMVAEMFDGEEAARTLLCNYVTLQLLSDASFCLDRWKTKGGGRPRTTNHNKTIVEWQWRALWDIYVASYINTPAQLQYFGLQSSSQSIHDLVFRRQGQ